MPFPQTERKLNELITQALENDSEIRDGLDKARLKKDEVYALISVDSSEIWEPVATEITRFDEREAQLTSARRIVADQLGRRPSVFEAQPSGWVLGPGCLLQTLYVGAFFFFNRHETWRDTFGTANWPWLVGIGALFVLWSVGNVWSEKKQKRKLAQDEREWEIKKDDLLKRHDVTSLGNRLEASRSFIEKEILEKKIKPKLRELINSRLTASYAPQLEVREAKGLAEIFDPQIVIDTSARKSLRFMLENMPGGSIGIAGPRGSGKSTLLRLFCGPKRILSELKGKPVLPVLVSAPVAYQPRDFILHLFASLCRSVLETQGVRYEVSGPRTEEFGTESVATPIVKSFVLLPRICIVLGAILLVFSLATTALLTAVLPTKPQGEKAVQERNANFQTGSSAQQTQVLQSESTSARFLRTLDLKPGTLLTWGIFFLLVGAATAPILDSSFFAGAWRQLVTYSSPATLRPLIKRILTYRASSTTEPKLKPEPQIESQPAINSLQAEAKDWLKRIKFQQSYTSGWSGAFKLPVGLEGGLNNAVTFAENQLSLPEIVHFFTDFVEQVSQNYEVIIGIDEVDKLESEKKAEQFLNDLKSVFGLERCFYLVTVSENAMSSFERRGLPFRDIFDSSFDSVVYVDYLNFESTKTLLEQRVVGRPIPFFGLSYSMSGGLARDLIRGFRSIIEIRQSGVSDLRAICQAFVSADLKAKIRATAISAKKVDLEPEANQFLNSLYQLEDKLTDEEALLEAAWHLLPQQVRSETRTGAEINSEPRREKLNALSEELATYLYFAVTILQIFNNSITETTLNVAVKTGSLDSLARARQVLAVNPGISRAILNQFRSAHELAQWDLTHN